MEFNSSQPLMEPPWCIWRWEDAWDWYCWWKKSHLPHTNMLRTMGEARPINCFFLAINSMSFDMFWWWFSNPKRPGLVGELGSLVRLHTPISGSKINYLKIYGFEQDLWSMVSNRIYDPLTSHVLFLDYFGICVLTSRFLIVLRWWMVIWKKAGNQMESAGTTGPGRYISLNICNFLKDLSLFSNILDESLETICRQDKVLLSILRFGSSSQIYFYTYIY